MTPSRLIFYGLLGLIAAGLLFADVLAASGR